MKTSANGAAFRLPHCCLVVESISAWLPVSEGRCDKPCADITVLTIGVVSCA